MMPGEVETALLVRVTPLLLGEANTKITKLEQSIQHLEDLLNEAQVSHLEVIDQRINDRILEVLGYQGYNAGDKDEGC